MTASSPTAVDAPRSSGSRIAGAKTRTWRHTVLPLATAVGGAVLGLAADLCVRPLTRGKLVRAFDSCTPMDDSHADRVSRP